MKPYLCPVCEGIGKVPGGFYDGNPNPVLAREECKACSGTGILWGSDFSIDVQAPDSVPWVNPLDPSDGNTTFPPYTITWENPGDTMIPLSQSYEITDIPAYMLYYLNRDDRPIVMNPRREM